MPGPACYGRGGTEPTVTDADLVAGRMLAVTELAGIGRVRSTAAQAALDRAGVTAEGVVAVVDAAMEQALRPVSVERGVDPRELALVAFGGAGPLHACGLADALGMPAVVVPPRAGVLSAVGLLCAPLPARRRAVVADARRPRGLTEALGELAAACTAAVGGTGPELETASTAATPGRATRSRCRASTTSPPSTGGATATTGPTRRSRWSRCGPPPAARRHLAVTDLPDVDRPPWSAR